MGSTAEEKPLILIGCAPIYGHISPVRAVAKNLVERGYDVTAVSSSHWRPAFEEIGCSYVPITGYGDFWEGDFTTRFAAREALPPGPPQLAWDVEHIFMRPIPDQYEAQQNALLMLKEKYPGRKVVQLAEALFQGGLCVARGARGLKPDAMIGLGVIPVTLSSIDLAPFGPGLLPDLSPEGRNRNAAMQQQVDELIFGGPNKVLAEMYESVGAGKLGCSMTDAAFLLNDRFLQFCPPSAEYQRSDREGIITFTGGLPKGSRDAMANPPEWWIEVVENKEKKDIVFVCQGTLPGNDYGHLTIPTMEGLKDRPNTLVVVAVGKKGENLPEGTSIPANGRVADYIPYDDILPLAKVFVTNGGYGAFQHGIKNGTPLLLAGAGEDKPETSARAEWAGIGINLRTGVATAEAIRNGVDELIADSKYKQRALEMQAEMEEFDPMEVVVKTIQESAARAA